MNSLNSIHPVILHLIAQGKISLGGGHVEQQYLKELQLKSKVLHADQKRLNKYLSDTNQNN